MIKDPQLLSYDIATDVMAFSSTRHGGYSQGNYGEFNINPFCGDNPVNIESNRKALCEKLSLDENDLILPHQVHRTEIKIIEKGFRFLDKKEKAKQLEGIDALITKENGICIAVSTADCVPVLLYSPEQKVVAAIHAGWRGTLDNITGKTASQLIKLFNVKAETLQAVIGPSISQRAFEVGDEVYDAYKSRGFDMEEIAAKTGNKWHIDLWKANSMQLKALSIKDKNINKTNICTYSDENFFSARRLGINSGRIVTGIILKRP